MPKQRKKRKALWPRILLIIVLLLGIAGIGTFLYIRMNLEPVGNGEETISFEITEGETFDSVLSSLEEKNMIRSDSVAKLYARFTGMNQYYAGLFELNDGMSTTEILSYIGNQENARQEEKRLTVPEGTWAKEVAASISSLYPSYSTDEILSLWNDSEYIQTLSKDYAFLDADALNNDNYKVKLEGYLFPETYFLADDADLDTITRTMLNQFSIFYEEHKSAFENSTYSVHELVILASVVQFESGTKQDMASIAGVFYNRLNQDMRLESSVTVCYALYDQFDDPQDCETQTDVDSPYNTYLNNGLPVGPILNPGGDALLAVLEPESSEYLFFAADIHGDGKVYYSKTYEEHQRICEELGLILN